MMFVHVCSFYVYIMNNIACTQTEVGYTVQWKCGQGSSNPADPIGLQYLQLKQLTEASELRLLPPWLLFCFTWISLFS